MEEHTDIGEAVHAAVRGGHVDTFNDLLENGATLAVKNTDGRVPLHVAAEAGKSEMVQLLLRKGADKNALDTAKTGGCTPLHLAAMFGHTAVGLALLAAGANVNLRCGSAKMSAVYLAARNGRVDILKAMIEHGADVDAVSVHEETAMHGAAATNMVKTIDVLAEAGAFINPPDEDGYTPLHFAAEHLRLEAATALLRHGAIVNVHSHRMNTPLHKAATEAQYPGAAEVIDLLLRSGADKTRTNVGGDRAIDLVGKYVFSAEDEDVENLERVRQVFVSTPADRDWHRRGYLLLCRAHPDRLQLGQEPFGNDAGVARSTRSGTKVVGTNASGYKETADGKRAAEERTSCTWAGAMAKMLLMQEEKIFRTIVGYL